MAYTFQPLDEALGKIKVLLEWTAVAFISKIILDFKGVENKFY